MRIKKLPTTRNLLGLFLFVMMLVCAHSKTMAQTCINWETQFLISGTTVANGSTYTVGNTTLRINSFFETNGGVASNGFTYNAGAQGNHSGHLEAVIDNNTIDIADRYQITFTFSRPVTGLNFSLLDVDQGTHDDAVEIYYNGGINIKTISPAVYTLGASVQLDDETYMDGFEGAASVAATSTAGNIGLNFGPTPVTSVTIVYFNTDDGTGNPEQQILGISDVCWTGNAIALTNCTAWESLGITGGVAIANNTAFATGDNNRFTVGHALTTSGGAPTYTATYNAGANGGHTGFMEVLLDNDAFDPNDFVTTTLTFDKPVSGLKFSVLDVDLNATVPGFRDGVEIFADGVNIRAYPGAYTLGTATTNVAPDDETYMDGFEGTASTTGTDAFSNINIDLGSRRVTTITIRYRSTDDGTGNPNQQAIGISDLCWVQDKDLDGVPDYVDADDDNDGLTDVLESATGLDPLADPDGDNLPNFRDGGNAGFTDTNSDGIDDRYDTDLNGGINAQDLDSDNDGVPDISEAGGVDTNGDGKADGTTDTDGDGLIDTYDVSVGGDALANRDTDGDAVPNTRDLDSDNDGLPDIVELLVVDANNDGKVDATADADLDGLVDAYDPDDNNDGTMEGAAQALVLTGSDANSDGLADSFTRGDLDGDSKPNAFDLDSDGDGVLDVREAAILDADNNGIADGTLGADGWSDAVDAQTSLIIRNTDGTGRANYLDIDSDDDGIPDIIEAQATATYQAPLGTDSDNDGIDNRYDNNNAAFGGNASNGITPVNSDVSGNADYLDTDSDNDGKLDRVEGWDTNGNGIIDGGEVAFVGASDADGDGLYDEYDVNDAVTNPTNGATPTSYPDFNNPGGDRDWRQAIDSDGDGVADRTDTDDDNDGIPDTSECIGCITDVFTNGSFEIPAIPANTNQQVNQTTVTGWNTTAADGLIELWGTGFNGVPAAVGNAFVELNATQASSLYQNFCLSGAGATITWSFRHRGRLGTDVADFKIGNSLATMLTQATATDGNTAWGSYNGVYTVPAGVTNIFIGFTALSTATGDQSIGNFIDDVQITIVENCDTDGDGIVNRIDLDTDNDGITDLVEAGGVDGNGDGRIDGVFADSDGDGLHNTYDPTTGGDAIQNRDSDDDGVVNVRDADSDNDGIPDVVEAGGTDANNDGRIDGFTDTDGDGLAQSVDGDTNNDGTTESSANALIITGTDADSDGDPETYLRANIDGNGLPNPYDLDSDGDGILDVREAGLTDATNDGIADATTRGPDGWSDEVDALASLALPNTDGITNPNFLDLDSDNDGIVDNIEAQATTAYVAPANADADGDGIDDNYDNNDALFGGGANNGLAPVNTESAGNPDYADTDTDNDGKPDAVEGWDTNGNGSINGAEKTGGDTDIDNDGLLDGYDNNTALAVPNNGTTPASYPDVNTPGGDRDWRQVSDFDNDGVNDFVDADDDNDGIIDALESSTSLDPLADPDGDGLPNYLDTGNAGFVDANGDGVDDRYDTDGDGVLNTRDGDSDNDGIPDLVEAGGVDINGDGRIDGPFTDADGDGLSTTYDPNNGGNAINNRDTDGDGIPNSRDTDSDGDGIADVWEAGGTDANNDGKIDSFVDTDGDGLSDPIDGDVGNDGTAENTANALLITGTDTNTDGIPNSYPRANKDGTGLPNAYDLDSDGDGILDVTEAGLPDADHNGIVDGTGGTDGWSDTVDGLATFTPLNSDLDRYADFVDIDSDNDGITDNVEGQSTSTYALPSGVDSDNDGIDNAYDNDDALYAGALNNGIVPLNFPGSLDAPDYRDTDSDDDGVPDVVEAHDFNLNSVPDDDVALTGVDTDGDGLDDKFDLDNTGPNVKMQGLSANGAYVDPPSPGARGPMQPAQVGDLERQWRNALSALPVTLVSFNGRAQSDNKVQLNWQVENEESFKGYEVERSVDGVSFTKVGFVPGRGALSATYDFVDDLGSQRLTKAYYRLKLVDLNERFTYSRVLIVSFGNIGGITLVVTPNPAQDNVVLRVFSHKKVPAIIHVVDGMGRVLHRQQATIADGNNVIPLAWADRLVTGIYTIVVDTGKEKLTTRLVIQR